MTALTRIVSPVTRRPESRDAGRQLVVSLIPGDLLEFRLSRSRKRWTLPVAAAYAQAVRRALAAEERTKPKRRRRR